MAIRRLSARNGHATLARRIEDLEAATHTIRARREPQDALATWWRDFLAAAPEPMWVYVEDISADADADPDFRPDDPAWCERRHPAWMNAVEALHHAWRRGDDMSSRLRYVQGSMVKWADWRLGWEFAFERARANGKGPCYDPEMQDRAARALLDWSVAESHTAWADPLVYLARWREAATRDAETLELAGLHAAELELLTG